MSRLLQHSLSSNKRNPTTTAQRGMLVFFVCGCLVLLTIFTLMNGGNETLVYDLTLQSSSSLLSSSGSSNTAQKLQQNDYKNDGTKDDDFAVASYESYGFFNDITAREWKLMKQRVQDVYPNTMGLPAELKARRNIRANDFYQDHYEPEFACRHERRVGKLGDGGKWVCDPHRLADKPDCLVYSVGSEGDASFEAAVLQQIGSHCEIHTFDMGAYKAPVERAGSHFHQWGIAAQSTLNGNSYTGPGMQRGRGQFKSLPETIQLLNHTGRTIDLFKIDCEYCEWDVFPAFFESGVHLQQVLIELHAFQKPMPMPQTVNFFQAMFQHGYVIFHKEVNIKHWVGEAIEFAFVKLRPEFFADIPALPSPQEQSGAADSASAARASDQNVRHNSAANHKQREYLDRVRNTASYNQRAYKLRDRPA